MINGFGYNPFDKQFNRNFSRARKGFFAVAAFAVVAWFAGLALVGTLIWALVKFLGRH